VVEWLETNYTDLDAAALASFHDAGKVFLCLYRMLFAVALPIGFGFGFWLWSLLGRRSLVGYRLACFACFCISGGGGGSTMGAGRLMPRRELPILKSRSVDASEEGTDTRRLHGLGNTWVS